MPRLAALFFLTALLLTATPANAQSSAPRTPFSADFQTDWLQEALPQATDFSAKEGEPPVYRGTRENPATGQQELIGYVFLSADLPPEEKGYSAPIDMLIGLNTQSEITGIKVLDYTESFRYSLGDFVADAIFLNQFQNKPIADDFRLVQDVDGLAGATMTSYGIARGVRNAARRVATAYLDYKEDDAIARAIHAKARDQLQGLSWEDLLAQGIVKKLSMPMLTGTELEFTLTYIGHPALGEHFIGVEDFARAERDSGIRLGGQHLVLLAVGGSADTQFRQHLLAVQQGEGPVQRIQQRRFVTGGNADAGAIAGHASYAGVIVLEDDIDITQHFSIVYQPQGSQTTYTLDYTLSPLALALASGETSLWLQLRYAPLWSETQWLPLILLVGLLGMSVAAFLRKSTALRWATLTVTLGYLGFYQGGFLSVSHITGALVQGPGLFLSNLPMLVLVVFTLVTTLLWGRIFCSSLCPFGALQDFLTRLAPRRWRVQVPQWLHDRALWIKYGILAIIFALAIVNSEISVFQYFEPFGTLFFFSGSVLLWTILLAILVASLVIERFYCRYVCPLGAALGVLATISPWRISRVEQCGICKVCEHTCPTGAIRSADIDFKECVRCDLCERKLIDKAGSCRHTMTEIVRRQTRNSRIPLANVQVIDP